MSGSPSMISQIYALFRDPIKVISAIVFMLVMKLLQQIGFNELLGGAGPSFVHPKEGTFDAADAFSWQMKEALLCSTKREDKPVPNAEEEVEYFLEMTDHLMIWINEGIPSGPPYPPIK